VRIVPVEAAIADIRNVRRHRLRPVIFWDDNLFNSKKWAQEFFTRLKDCRVTWIGQSTLLLANDPQMLKLAAESGCAGLFIGIESFSQASLAGTSKGFNKVKMYKEQCKRIHNFGIAIEAGIVFGFEHDDKDTFERTVETAIEIKLDLAAFSILVPYPGTELYRRLEREGRIITTDLSKYDSDSVVFRPKNMTSEELLDGWRWAQHQFYSIPGILRRLWGRGYSARMQLVTNFQYRWFTKIRFSKGRIPRKSKAAMRHREDT
jgi:radical SAM superfamily enzyme YgiQ (UPF0313 family)